MWNDNLPVIKNIQINKVPCILVSSNDSKQKDKGYLIILHKLLERKEYELQSAYLLAQQGFKCILVDLYSHGEDENKIPNSIAELVYLSVKKINILILELSKKNSEINLMGVSLGALVSLCLASYSNKINKVVALLGSGKITELSKINSFNKFQKGFGKELFASSHEEYFDFFDKYDPYNNPIFLDNTKLLMINGSLDFTIPINLVRETASVLKSYSEEKDKKNNFEYLELPFRGHQCTPDIYEKSLEWIIK